MPVSATPASVFAGILQRDRDRTLQRELQRVRQRFRTIFPTSRDRPRFECRAAVHFQPQPRHLAGSPKLARSAVSPGDRAPVHAARPASMREIEQCIDQLEQTLPVPWTTCSRSRFAPASEPSIQWLASTEAAELVTHVEERSFLPIERGQRFRPAAFVVVRLRVGDRGGNWLAISCERARNRRTAGADEPPDQRAAAPPDAPAHACTESSGACKSAARAPGVHAANSPSR